MTAAANAPARWLSFLGTILAFFVVPEAKGRSLEEINDDSDTAIMPLALAAE